MTSGQGLAGTFAAPSAPFARIGRVQPVEPIVRYLDAPPSPEAERHPLKLAEELEARAEQYRRDAKDAAQASEQCRAWASELRAGTV